MTTQRRSPIRHDFIDERCIITPQPRGEYVTSLFVYDYEDASGQQPARAVALLAPEREIRGDLAFNVFDPVGTAQTDAPIPDGSRCRIELTYDAGSYQAELTLHDVSPTGTVTARGTTFRAYALLAAGLTPAQQNLITAYGAYVPHALALHLSSSEQIVLFRAAKSGDRWVRLVLKRI